MNFESYGPFELDWFSDAKQWRKEFWDNVDKKLGFEGLAGAIGIYVFTLEYGGKHLPWYVGKTVNQDGFSGEIFTDHKYEIYQKLIETDKQRHKPHFMFFPLMRDVGDDEWDFSANRSEGGKQIDWLESTMIGMAYAVNRELQNVQKTKFAKNLYVNGLIGSQYPGRLSIAAQKASKIFGLS